MDNKKQPNQVKLYKKQYGANVIIGIEGRSAELITRYFNGLYNHNGVPADGNFEVSVETADKAFGYFQTGLPRFKKALCGMMITGVMNDKYLGRGQRKKSKLSGVSLNKIFNLRVDKKLEEMPEDYFVGNNEKNISTNNFKAHRENC